MGLGVSVVERSDYGDVRVGEHITPATLHYLRAMGFPAPDDEEAHLSSSGVDAWWGASTASHIDYFLHPGGRGFNLSRPLFDASLAEKCRENGAAILTSARLVHADWKRGRWVVEVKSGDKARLLHPRFVVDATGRSAAVARSRGSFMRADDQQIAVVAVGCGRTDPDQSAGRVLIESAEAGWWYFAPLSAGRCVCMFVTDADLLPSRAKAHLPLWWRPQLQHTSRVRSRVARYSLANPIVRCARSQRLDRFAGSGWCAVGDAAMSFDPLSSRGIAKAVEHGHRAAHAIAADLSGDRDAMREYCNVLDDEYQDYRRTRMNYYNIERRWPDAEFWLRRQTTPERTAATRSGVLTPF